MNRLLTFHIHETSGNEVRMAPSAYYMEADYEKVSVRIYAEDAPARDAKFNIYSDGVSIFNNRTPRQFNATTGLETTGADATEAVLTAGTNSENLAEDFTDSYIESGSWVYCNLVDSGGAKNITVQLELRQVSEDESQED